MVDVIVPVHDPARPVEAAVRSALSETQGVPTRVIVVLHNYVPHAARRRALEDLATVISIVDGIASASGPRNAGIREAAAPFVFPLDSDDQLAPGCLRTLCQVAREVSADVVLPSIRVGRSFLGTPPVWSKRVRELRVVEDALFMRSHCPALLRRSHLVEVGAAYPEGIRVSEDLVFMARLYTISRVALAFDAVYLASDAESGRSSAAEISSDEQLAFVYALLKEPWAGELSSTLRQSLARRLLSTNLAGGWRRRTSDGQQPDRGAYLRALEEVSAYSPSAVRLLSLRDRAGLSFPAPDSFRGRLLASRVLGLVPSSISGVLSKQGPVTIEARVWLTRRRKRLIPPTEI